MYSVLSLLAFTEKDTLSPCTSSIYIYIDVERHALKR
jgi:hypothetical protein